MSVVTDKTVGEARVQQPAAPGEDSRRLVAVVGLCGGAGASTLAYLLCCAAIVEGRRPVLCVDATGRGGIAA